jgi:hypothetical protein
MRVLRTVCCPPSSAPVATSSQVIRSDDDHSPGVTRGHRHVLAISLDGMHAVDPDNPAGRAAKRGLSIRPGLHRIVSPSIRSPMTRAARIVALTAHASACALPRPSSSSSLLLLRLTRP